jgi:vancomycin resistance protein YoaR
MDELNDFGFSTVSESDFTATAKEPETKVVEAAVKEAKAGQIKEVEGTVNKIWSLLDYHYEDIDKHKDKLNKEYEIKMKTVEDMIVPLLNNLAKSSTNEYIYWPNRREILEKQIEKITAHTRDVNIFTD